MKKKQRKNSERDFEFECEIKLLMGEENEIERILAESHLEKNEKTFILQRLERTRQILHRYDEDFETVNLQDAYRNIMDQNNSFVAGLVKRPKNTGQELILFPFSALLHPQFVATGELKDDKMCNTDLEMDVSSEKPTRFIWLGKELDGMKVRTTPKSRIIFEIPSSINQVLSIEFLDSEWRKIQPRVSHQLDQYGRISYDFSDIPLGKYLVVFRIGNKSNV